MLNRFICPLTVRDLHRVDVLDCDSQAPFRMLRVVARIVIRKPLDFSIELSPPIERVFMRVMRNVLDFSIELGLPCRAWLHAFLWCYVSCLRLVRVCGAMLTDTRVGPLFLLFPSLRWPLLCGACVCVCVCVWV